MLDVWETAQQRREVAPAGTDTGSGSLYGRFHGLACWTRGPTNRYPGSLDRRRSFVTAALAAATFWRSPLAHGLAAEHSGKKFQKAFGRFDRRGSAVIRGLPVASERNTLKAFKRHGRFRT